jgi:6,7-dimethyl-8-ribityllumazine synthase
MGAEKGAGLPPGALEELDGRVGRVVAEGPFGSHEPGAGDPRPGGGLRVGVACSRFNGDLTWRLLAGALEALEECGVDRGDVTVAFTPGAFELPQLARALIEGGADAVACLGAVVRGDTDHYQFVAGECARGIQQVQLETGVPVAFGVLTTEDHAQALARSEPGEANKGREAALTAVEMARLLRAV